MGDAIVPQQIDIVPEGATLIPGTGDIPNGGRIFTPFWTERISMKPGTMGGANWPPSAYDPESHWLYVCASDRISDFVVRLPLETPGPNKVYMGGSFTQAEIDDAGVFAALDVTTNRIVWRQHWREICYSGAVVTAGGLVFVGRADGRLTALDKRDGRMLWSFLTDAGVNTTVTTFEHKGNAARRRARGRRRICQRQARGRHLDVLARRQDRAGARGRGCGWWTGRAWRCRLNTCSHGDHEARESCPRARRSTRLRVLRAMAPKARADMAAVLRSSPIRMWH